VEGVAPPVLTLLPCEELPLDSAPQIAGVPEEEVEERVQAARNAAIEEAEERLREETERLGQEAQQKIGEALRAFEQERQAYFRRVEREIVTLSLAIARKILEREAEMDPSLLATLVQLALERMQCGSAVRVRVAPSMSESWRRLGEKSAGDPRWEIVADAALKPGDCIVETSVGSANFGFDAQLNEVEQSLLQLLAQSRAA
jgi:flagellar assembly protein FliH